MQQNKKTELEKTYPNNIKECIKRQGYTIGEVADEIGIARRTLTNYVAGTVPTPRLLLEKIAYTIACDVEELLPSATTIDKSKQITQSPTSISTTDQEQTILLLTDRQKEVLNTLLALDDDLFSQNNDSTSNHISRRAFLQQVLGAIGLAYSLPLGNQLPTQTNNSFISEDLIKLFENSMAANWELYHTGGAARVVNGLDIWIKEISSLSKSAQGTNWHNRTLTLLTMGYQLQSCVLRDTMNYAQAAMAHQRAFHIAQELNDSELMASTLARKGVTLIQQERPKEAIIHLSGALDITNDDLPSLKGHILQALAEAYAKDQQSQESWIYITQAESYLGTTHYVQERSLIRGVTPASISAQKGINAVLLHDYKQAINLIDESLNTYDPALIRGRARLIAQKAEAYCGLGMIDDCTTQAFTAVALARSAGSNKSEDRIKALYNKLIQSSWGKEQSVIQLGQTLSMNK